MAAGYSPIRRAVNALPMLDIADGFKKLWQWVTQIGQQVNSLHNSAMSVFAGATSDTTINSTAYTAITGATNTFFVPTRTTFLIIASFLVTATTRVDGEAFMGALGVDGTQLGVTAQWNPAGVTNGAYITLSVGYLVSLNGGNHTLALYAKESAHTTSSYTVQSGSTVFRALAISAA